MAIAGSEPGGPRKMEAPIDKPRPERSEPGGPRPEEPNSNHGYGDSDITPLIAPSSDDNGQSVPSVSDGRRQSVPAVSDGHVQSAAITKPVIAMPITGFTEKTHRPNQRPEEPNNNHGYGDSDITPLIAPSSDGNEQSAPAVSDGRRQSVPAVSDGHVQSAATTKPAPANRSVPSNPKKLGQSAATNKSVPANRQVPSNPKTFGPAQYKYNVTEVWNKAEDTINKAEANKKLVVKRSGWKTVRIFVSSTFKDFHAEREVLVKEVRVW